MTVQGLWPQHRAYLTARGVADDVIAERKVFSVPTKAALQTASGSAAAPRRRRWCAVVGRVRRPATATRSGPTSRGSARTAGSASSRCRTGSGPASTCTRGPIRCSADPSIPLWITEGIPKGDALVTVGAAGGGAARRVELDR